MTTPQTPLNEAPPRVDDEMVNESALLETTHKWLHLSSPWLIRETITEYEQTKAAIAAITPKQTKE